MRINTIALGYLQANCYTVYEEDGGECIVIDPGYNSTRYTDFIEEHNLRCVAVLLTHNHPDHVGGASKLSAKLGCPIFMHRLDAASFKGQVDVPLEGGEELELAGFKIRVYHTPGHSPGGLCFDFYEHKTVFSGDTIFDIDLGVTRFDGGSEEDLAWSCRNVIDKWEDDVMVYPGHDVPATMAYIREHNKEFIALRDGRSR